MYRNYLVYDSFRPLTPPQTRTIFPCKHAKNRCKQQTMRISIHIVTPSRSFPSFMLPCRRLFVKCVSDLTGSQAATNQLKTAELLFLENIFF